MLDKAFPLWDRKMEPRDYRGFHITVETNPMLEVDNQRHPRMVFFGKLVAVKEEALGERLLMQPMWLIPKQIKKLRTDLDKASALDFMLDKAWKMLKADLDRYHKGQLDIPVLTRAREIGRDDVDIKIA